MKYPNIGNQKSDKKNIYWKCVYTFCATSVRVNHEKKHLVITNDYDDVIIDNKNIKKELSLLGVELIYLNFDTYDPGKFSKIFRNAFYKLQVFERLSQEALPSILLDSDILWHKKDTVLDEIISKGEVLVLQDTYQRNNHPLKRSPHNLSMKDMGDTFYSIGIQSYNEPYPIWYGGEITGGSPKTFGVLAKNILELLDYCKEQEKNGNKIYFPNGSSIFDGDEFLSSFVYNSIDIEIYDTNKLHSKRLLTGEISNNVMDGDEKIPIWHVTSEKVTGLKKLFDEAINPNSEFWNTKNFTEYLGKFVGIPKRKFKKKSLPVKVKDLIYNQLRFLNSNRKKMIWWFHSRYISNK
ncbi:hypothetical protein ACFSKL_13350 [Belliella marina]|uniref:Uncharacterized protein n=1 Tax=Belliella marina TaxID=1644146 RepID=A0ABW4VP04_9BACT